MTVPPSPLPVSRFLTRKEWAEGLSKVLELEGINFMSRAMQACLGLPRYGRGLKLEGDIDYMEFLSRFTPVSHHLKTARRRLHKRGGGGAAAAATANSEKSNASAAATANVKGGGGGGSGSGGENNENDSHSPNSAPPSSNQPGSGSKKKKAPMASKGKSAAKKKRRILPAPGGGGNGGGSASASSFGGLSSRESSAPNTPLQLGEEGKQQLGEEGKQQLQLGRGGAAGGRGSGATRVTATLTLPGLAEEAGRGGGLRAGSGGGGGGTQPRETLAKLARVLARHSLRLQTLFMYFDYNGSGLISKLELRTGLLSLQATQEDMNEDLFFTEEEIEELFEYLDRGGTGRISRREFFGAFSVRCPELAGALQRIGLNKMMRSGYSERPPVSPIKPPSASPTSPMGPRLGFGATSMRISQRMRDIQEGKGERAEAGAGAGAAPPAMALKGAAAHDVMETTLEFGSAGAGAAGVGGAAAREAKGRRQQLQAQLQKEGGGGGGGKAAAAAARGRAGSVGSAGEGGGGSSSSLLPPALSPVLRPMSLSLKTEAAAASGVGAAQDPISPMQDLDGGQGQGGASSLELWRRLKPMTRMRRLKLMSRTRLTKLRGEGKLEPPQEPGSPGAGRVPLMKAALAFVLGQLGIDRGNLEPGELRELREYTLKTIDAFRERSAEPPQPMVLQNV